MTIVLFTDALQELLEYLLNEPETEVKPQAKIGENSPLEIL